MVLRHSLGWAANSAAIFSSGGLRVRHRRLSMVIRQLTTPAAHVLRHFALGRGGVGLFGVASWGVVWGEAKIARRAIPVLAGAPLADGIYGTGDGDLLHLTMMGDSTACGLGADRPEERPGARIATALADDLAAGNRRVLLEVAAISGSRSSDLEAQVNRVLLTPPDVAVVSVGANDIIHWVAPGVAVGDLSRALHRLREAGVAVVLGTCPNLGTAGPLPPPLRQVAAARCITLATAQRAAADTAGAHVVPLGVLGPVFRSDHTLFCSDRFHPSGAGYRYLAAAFLPAVREAVGSPSPAVGTGTGRGTAEPVGH